MARLIVETLRRRGFALPTAAAATTSAATDDGFFSDGFFSDGYAADVSWMDWPRYHYGATAF